MIFVDEAAFVPLEMFWEVVVPLIGMETSVLFLCSTPVDTYNFFTRLMNLTDPDTGKPLFLIADMQLSCSSCTKRGRPTLCTHRLKYLPPWKSKKKQKIMNIIMKDQETILARENYGLVQDVGESFIGKIAIDKWLKDGWFDPEPSLRANVIVMTMDPNFVGTADGSRQAIVSTALLYGKRVVRPSFFGVLTTFMGSCVCVESRSTKWV